MSVLDRKISALRSMLERHVYGTDAIAWIDNVLPQEIERWGSHDLIFDVALSEAANAVAAHVYGFNTGLTFCRPEEGYIAPEYQLRSEFRGGSSTPEQFMRGFIPVFGAILSDMIGLDKMVRNRWNTFWQRDRGGAVFRERLLDSTSLSEFEDFLRALLPLVIQVASVIICNRSMGGAGSWCKLEIGEIAASCGYEDLEKPVAPHPGPGFTKKAKTIVEEASPVLSRAFAGRPDLLEELASVEMLH